MKKGKKLKHSAFCSLWHCCLFCQNTVSAGYGVGKGRVVHLQQWMVSAEGWEKMELKLPCFVTADKDGQTILYNDMLSEADKGKILSIWGIQDQLEVCIGDRLLYQYKDNRFEKTGRWKGKYGQIFLCWRKSGRKCYQSAMKLKRMPDYMCMPRWSESFVLF